MGEVKSSRMTDDSVIDNRLRSRGQAWRKIMPKQSPRKGGVGRKVLTFLGAEELL